MAILDLILGRPLSSEEDKDERVGSFAGISVAFALTIGNNTGSATVSAIGQNQPAIIEIKGLKTSH